MSLPEEVSVKNVPSWRFLLWFLKYYQQFYARYLHLLLIILKFLIGLKWSYFSGKILKENINLPKVSIGPSDNMWK